MPVLSNPSSPITGSSRDRVNTLRPEVQDQYPTLNNQAIMDESGVRASFLNNTSVDSDRFENELSVVAGYPEGRIILVTYFSKNRPLLDAHSMVSDIEDASLKDDVHKSWTQIRNFELRLPSEININYNRDNNVTEIGGEALVFAGFEPHVNDNFLYQMRNGKIGIFLVTDMERTGLGHDTYHKISFSITGWLGPQDRDTYQRQTTEVMYFDKAKFVAGNHALLSTEGYIQQNELMHLRKELIQNYLDRFYNETYSSFIRPDGIYDPYVVEYWNKKVGYDDTNLRPTQLLISTRGFTKTIWNILTDGPIRSVTNVEKDYAVVLKTHHSLDTHVTSLIDANYIAVGKDQDGLIASSSGTITDGVDESMTWDYDFLPYYIFNQSASKLKSYHDRIWDQMRLRFYQDNFPYQKCPPSVHYTTEPHLNPGDCTKCGNLKCEYAQHKPDYVDYIGHDLTPPFPIRSNDELLAIWLRINRIAKGSALTESQLAQIRGYIKWYRDTYPGTLSKTELETQWRTAGSIAPDKELTPEEQAGLIEYIKSYRSNYLLVLTDREIEIVARTKLGFGYKDDLTEDQLKQIAEIILIYRDNHGQVPDDGYTRPVYPIGRALTPEEVKGAGAIHYDDVIVMSLTLREYDLAQRGEAEHDDKDPLPAEYVPKVYLPKLRGYRYCPSLCYYQCRNKSSSTKATTKTVSTNSYVLSPEFYLGSLAMTEVERMLYDIITGHDIDVSKILALVKLYLTWDDETAFYRHLICLYLIDYSLYWLKFHS